MSSSSNRLLLIATAWAVLVGAYILMVPLAVGSLSLSRFEILLLFTDWWDLYLGEATVSLDQFVSERFDLWLVALFVCCSGLAIGRLCFRTNLLKPLALELNTLDLNLLAYGLGLSLISSVTLLVGLLGFLNVWVLSAILLTSLLSELWLLSRRPTKKRVTAKTDFIWRPHIGLVLACVPFVGLMFLGSTQPPLDFDVREYHLQGPKEYYQQGQITFLAHNVYTSFPFLTEMLSLLGMVLRMDWYRGALVGKVILMTFLPLTGLTLWSLNQKLFGVRAAWFALVMWLSIPWSHKLATTAYVEGGMLFFSSLCLLLVSLLWKHFRKPKLLNQLVALLGWMSGAAFACKYPALLWTVFPAGAAVLYFVYTNKQTTASEDPRRTPAVRKTVFYFGIGLLGASGLWLLKNLWQTGNPVFPLLYSVFGGESWDSELHQAWNKAHAVPDYNVWQIPTHLHKLFLDDLWQSPLLLMFAPLAFMKSATRKQCLMLALFGGYLWTTWWLLTHRIDRFWLPCLLPLTSLAAVGIVWNESRFWFRCSRVMFFVILGVNLSLNISSLGSPQPIGNSLAATINMAEQHAPLMHQLNGQLPPEANVLLVGEAQVFDARFQHEYNTVFNVSRYMELVATKSAESSSARWTDKSKTEIELAFAQQQFTHLAVNWEEIIRYRQTYGFEEEITPSHLQRLVKMEVLSAPKTLWGALKENFPPEQQQRLKEWAPELIYKNGGQEYVVLAQLYELSVPTNKAVPKVNSK